MMLRTMQNLSTVLFVCLLLSTIQATDNERPMRNIDLNKTPIPSDDEKSIFPISHLPLVNSTQFPSDKNGFTTTQHNYDETLIPPRILASQAAKQSGFDKYSKEYRKIYDTVYHREERIRIRIGVEKGDLKSIEKRKKYNKIRNKITSRNRKQIRERKKLGIATKSDEKFLERTRGYSAKSSLKKKMIKAKFQQKD